MDPQKRQYAIFIGALLLLFLISLSRIHLNVKITNLGYEIGKLKNKQTLLQKEHKDLTLNLSALTSRDHLLLLTKKEQKISKPER